MTSPIFPTNIEKRKRLDPYEIKNKKIGEGNENKQVSYKSDYNDLLTSPHINAHIILVYENEIDLDKAISHYINEGLNRGQLCIHATTNLKNKGYIENWSTSISNFDNNIQDGNLLLVDLTSFYVESMVGNLDLFKKLRDETVQRLNNDENRKDKHIRLTADCATLLLKNKHFEECINLENWWHRKPFEGSYLCPYPKSLIDNYLYVAYLKRIFHSHDIVVDSDGKIRPEYLAS